MSNIVAGTSTESRESHHRPPVVCEPWCRDGNGHTDAHFVEDQWCSSESEARVPLTREKLVQIDEGEWALDDMRVSAMREFEGRPFVALARGEALAVANLTPAEAIELGEALIAYGQMIKRGGTAEVQR